MDVSDFRISELEFYSAKSGGDEQKRSPTDTSSSSFFMLSSMIKAPLASLFDDYE